MPRLALIDHFVLTVTDIDRTIAFYRVLGMMPESFCAADGTTRHALRAPGFRINLHPATAPFRPHAADPRPGTADFCLTGDGGPDAWLDHLARAGIAVIEGPVARTGLRGAMRSIYLRDPDGNLIEIATYD